MNLTRFLERKEYDPDHTCLTPGAIYSTGMHGGKLEITITLPKDVELPTDPKKAKELEVDLHYAVEKILARLFGGKTDD